MNKFFFLHEYGAPSHVFALKYLLEQNDISLKYRELNCYRQLGSSVKHLSLKKLTKLCINIGFLISLLFSKEKTIVVGIAPYNYYLKWLRFFFKRHTVYYFTSYTCWDQTRMARSLFFSPEILFIWKRFLNDEVKHIFAVSELTRDELVRNGFSNTKNISIVNHSYEENIEPSDISKINNFIYVGRLTKAKGVSELLDIFIKHPKCTLTIVGDGDLSNTVRCAAEKNKNIHYLGYIKGLKNIIPIYKQNSFLLLNSHRTEKWEELFGITLIEGMACGLIPIATSHPGPREIITSYKNGILCEEGDIEGAIHYALNMDNDEFVAMKQKSILRGKEFRNSQIAKKWEMILNKQLFI